jgi:pimeloyl-ACP methyl ester carboxylesterase
MSVSPADLLFLHATGFNGQTYQPMLALLPADLRAEAWDLRGHGGSPLPADPAGLVSWQTYADDVIGQLAARQQPALVLAGHSMGAVVALLVAARRPDLVRGVVMIDPPMPPPLFRFYACLPGAITFLRRTLLMARTAARRRAHFPSHDAALAAWRGRGPFKTWQAGFLENYVQAGLKPDGGGARLACAPAWEQATFAAFRHDAWGALKNLRVPLHLMAGARHSTIAAALPAFLRCAPFASSETVPGTTHFVPMEVPQLVADRLASMVRHPENFRKLPDSLLVI